jgi:6-phosphogluconolactonase
MTSKASADSKGHGNDQPLLFAGSYTRKEMWTHGTGEGIYSFRFDSNDGTLTPLAVTPVGINPMHLQCSNRMFSSGKRVLYAVNSAAEEAKADPGTKTGFVSALAVSSDGSLKLLNALETRGVYPVHLSLSPNEDFLVVSNYGGGVTMYPLHDDGSLAEATFHHEFPNGSGVVTDRQEAGHTHSSAWLPDSNFVVIPDLGSDELHQFELNAATQTLKQLKSVRRPPGSGPRHIALHPSGRYAYVVDELANTIGVHCISPMSKLLEGDAIQNVPTLPVDFTGPYSIAGDIHLSSNGKFLYATNRGHNSIAMFRIDESDGTLTDLGWQDSRGDVPWGFTVRGDWLIVANAESDSVDIFKVDADSGLLEHSGHSYAVGTPTCPCSA